jgi:hypothetical protein
MTRSMVLLALVAHAGCEKTNGAYCDELTHCAGGLICDSVAHECVPPSSDLSAVADLAHVIDLAGVDLAGVDLSAPADFASAPPDLTMMSLPDLTLTPPDLTTTCQSSCSGACVGCCSDTCSSSGGCNQVCTSACNCALMCSNTNGANCQMTCNAASTCTGVAIGVQDVVLACQGRSTCDFTCTNLHDCNVTCDDTSNCVLRCDPGDHKCQFSMCSNPKSCPNNVIVCNRACP